MQETLDPLNRSCDAFSRGGRNGTLDRLADDVMHGIDQSERRTEHRSFAAIPQRMNRGSTERLADVAVMTTPNGTRAARHTVHGAYPKTDECPPEADGQPNALPGGAFFDIRGGRVTRLGHHDNLPEWIRQAIGPAADA